MTAADTPPKVTLSVIIPLARGDDSWRQLLPQLAPLTADGGGDEIILTADTPPPPNWQPPPDTRWLHTANSGRAQQMNAAAAAAAGDFLWFVHADSRLPAGTLAHLRTALAAHPAAVHYFDLRFYDGGARMRLNEWGVRLRCRLFKNPFGDQALCLARTQFAALGCYDETAPYGEDHLLVLTASRRGIALHRIPAAIGTSARRYTRHGWWHTVCTFQKLWVAQWRQHKPH